MWWLVQTFSRTPPFSPPVVDLISEKGGEKRLENVWLAVFKKRNKTKLLLYSINGPVDLMDKLRPGGDGQQADAHSGDVRWPAEAERHLFMVYNLSVFKDES